MDNVTRVLLAIEQGEHGASEELLPMVYSELRRLAAQRLANEKPGQTLQPTALVHEAYLRLVGNSNANGWNSRGHFFAAAAEAMRRILVENARRKARLKRGGDGNRIDIEPDDFASPVPDQELLEIDEALDHLENEFPDHAAVVKLRFFSGFTNAQTAEALGISTATEQIGDRTLYSETGQIIGTLEYMAPEQAEPGNVDLVITTSEADLGGGLTELTFNFTALDAVGADSPFTVALPVDVLEWGMSGLSWGNNMRYEIVGDEADILRTDGTPIALDLGPFNIGQTGTELEWALPLFAGGANLTAFNIGEF